MDMLAFGHPAATTIGTARHNHLHPVLDVGTSPSLVPRPMSARSCSASTLVATIGQVPDTACPVVSGRTPSTSPGTLWRTQIDADRERANGTEGIRTSSIARPQRRPAGHSEPSSGPAFAAYPRRKLSAGLAGGRMPRSGTVRESSYFRSL
jgi:hypothetical protein